MPNSVLLFSSHDARVGLETCKGRRRERRKRMVLTSRLRVGYSSSELSMVWQVDRLLLLAMRRAAESAVMDYEVKSS